MKCTINLPPYSLSISDFRHMEKEVDILFDARNYADALITLNAMKLKYPSRRADISDYIFIIYKELRQYQNALDEIAEAFKDGTLLPISDDWQKEGIATLEGYELLNKQINAAIKIEQEQYKQTELDIFLPNKSYDGDILLMLHGDYQCNKSFRDMITSRAYIDTGLALAYLQAPNLSGTDGYRWTTNYQKSRKAIKQAVIQIMAMCNISEENIIIVGFSGGAMAGINFISHKKQKFRHVIAICPMAGSYIGQCLHKDTNLVIYKGEFEPEIDALMADINQQVSAKEKRIKGMAHDITNFVDEIIMGELNSLSTIQI